MGWCPWLLPGLAGGMVVVAMPLAAQTAAREAMPAMISLELNRLEPIDGACRIYFVLQNRSASSFDKLTLELVSFGPDGLVGQRLGIDLAPLRAGKTVVKLFDLPGGSCDRVQRLLVNDMPACMLDGAPVDDCLDRLQVSSRAPVELFK